MGNLTRIKSLLQLAVIMVCMVLGSTSGSCAEQPLIDNISPTQFCQKMNGIGSSMKLVQMDSAIYSEVTDTSRTLALRYPSKYNLDVYAVFDGSNQLMQVGVNVKDKSNHDSFLTGIDLVYETLRVCGLNHSWAFDLPKYAVNESEHEANYRFNGRYYRVQVKYMDNMALFTVSAQNDYHGPLFEDIN